MILRRIIILFLVLSICAVSSMMAQQIRISGNGAVEKHEGYQHWNTSNAQIMQDSTIVTGYKYDQSERVDLGKLEGGSDASTAVVINVDGGLGEYAAGMHIVLEDTSYYFWSPNTSMHLLIWKFYNSTFIDTTTVTSNTAGYRGVGLGYDADQGTWVCFGYVDVNSMYSWTVSGRLTNASSWSTEIDSLATSIPVQMQFTPVPIHKGILVYEWDSNEMHFVDSAGQIHENVETGTDGTALTNVHAATNVYVGGVAYHDVTMVPEDLEGQGDTVYISYTESDSAKVVVIRAWLDVSDWSFNILDTDTIYDGAVPDTGQVAHLADSLSYRNPSVQMLGSEGMVIWCRNGTDYAEHADESAKIQYMLYTDRRDFSTQNGTLVTVVDQGSSGDPTADVQTPWTYMAHVHPDSGIVATTYQETDGGSTIYVAYDTLIIPAAAAEGVDPRRKRMWPVVMGIMIFPLFGVIRKYRSKS